jgi:hypothetical protein
LRVSVQEGITDMPLNRLARIITAACLPALSVGWAEGVSERQFTIPFAADTRDVHFAIAGTITQVSITPTAPNAHTQNKGIYGAGWNAAPGAGNYTVDVSRKGAGQWNFKYWLTTDGNADHHPDTGGTALASLFIDPTSGLMPSFYSIFGEYGSDASSAVHVDNLVATVVSGQDTFFSNTWYSSTGTDYNFAGGTISPGATHASFGTPFSVGANDWVKITANFNGVQQTFGYVNTPEPATTAVTGAGLIALSWALKRRRAQSSASQHVQEKNTAR